jgi:Flp pilus assembly protein protease CpaA
MIIMPEIPTTLLIIHSAAFLYLLAGAISDIKRREVADWANYGMICFGIAMNLIFSIVLNDWGFAIRSIIGFGIFLLLALAMFYTGQWGGGDSKMLMGMGALYGIGFNWNDSYFLISFIINTLIAGAIYGIIWSAVAAVVHREKFGREFRVLYSDKTIRKIRSALVWIALILIALLLIPFDAFFKIVLLSLYIALFGGLYLWVVVKAVEKSAMLKLVTPDKLTEGDWIAKEVKYKGEYITGPKDLGIEKSKIRILMKLYRQGKIKKVMIKEGIPFVPSFFLGWVTTVIFGNILSLISLMF